MIVCWAFPSRVSGRFIGTMCTTGDGSSGTIGFSTFLFHTTDSGILVAFGDWDLLRRL